MGWVLGGPTCQGVPVDIDAAADHVFGLVLLDDWSARDIQAWEYVPLGPFLGKSFATTVSAWVVSVDALEEARVPSPPQDPVPLPYLTTDQPWAFDIDLEVWMRPSGAPEPTRIASVNAARGLYWTIAQHVAHCTVNGASLRAGDLLGTGTISGPAPAERGSLLELSWNGEEPITIGDQERSFVEDGDEVTLTATFPFAGGRGSLGPASGTVVG
jgi:fumarylacetoacetase